VVSIRSNGGSCIYKRSFAYDPANDSERIERCRTGLAQTSSSDGLDPRGRSWYKEGFRDFGECIITGVRS
jgi:hypothetical protein